MTGRIFGNLTALRPTGNRDNDNRPLWLCVCTCGNEVIKTNRYLKKSKDPNLNCGFAQHPTKICTLCKEDKLKKEYHKCSTKTNPNGINPRCKKCVALFYEKNKEILELKRKVNMSNPDFRKRRLISSRKSYYKNFENQQAYKKEYTKRPEVIARAKEIHLYRLKHDLNYKLKMRLRWRLNDAIRKIGKRHKYNSSIFLVGCTAVFLKIHLENQFVDGMSWERFSEIEIDHIKPLSLFDLTDAAQQRIAFHYSNLQPLWALDNLRKGKKYPFDLTQKKI